MVKDVKTRVGIEDRATGKLRRASQEVVKHGKAWRTTASMATRGMRRMERGMRRMRAMISRLTRRLKFMMIGFQITAIIMGVNMVRAAMKYERALRNVTSLMAGVGMANEQIEKTFRSMDQQIRSMATRTGQMPVDLAEGMYNVVSATFDGASGLKVLEAAAVGAFAGLSNTATTTGLLTKTLQAYRKEGETNDDVAQKSMVTMDAYFMAVNRGMFTFDDLATKMGALPSTAAAFGVSLHDLLGFLSTATVRGVGLDESITGVRQAMIQIAKLTPQTAKAAEELFGPDFKEKWGAEALAAGGLHGVLLNLNEVLPDIPANIIEAAIAMEDEGGDAAAYMAQQIGGNIEAIAQLFPNIRALKAVLAVTGPGLELYGENMGFMAESAGAAGRAQEEMAKSTSGAMQFMKAAWEVFKIDVGSIVLPMLKTIADSMLNWWNEMPMRFAEQGGVFDEDFWEQGIPHYGAQLSMEQAAADFWAAASPGDRIGFILRMAWTDGLNNLREWFETGGGKEKIEGIGNWIGNLFANTLRGLAGVDKGGVQDSIGYQFGAAFIEGFTAAFEDFDWRGFFSSTFGTAMAAVIGGVIGGPGAAIGAGAAAHGGGDIQDVISAAIMGWAGWKILGGILRSPAGAAATGIAGRTAVTGAAGAGASTVGSTFLKRFLGPIALMEAIGFSGQNFPLSRDEMAGQFRGGGEGLTFETSNNKRYMEQSMDMMQDIIRVLEFTDQGDRARALEETYYSGAMAQLERYASAYGEYGRPGDALGAQRIAAGLENDPGFARWAEAQAAVEEATQTAAQDMVAAGNKFQLASVMMYGAAARMSALVGGPGQFIPPEGRKNPPQQRQALGSTGTVYKPTVFVAGEAGPEDFTFRPRRRGGAGASRGGGLSGAYVDVGGINIRESGDPRKSAAMVVRVLEKAVGNG